MGIEIFSISGSGLAYIDEMQDVVLDVIDKYASDVEFQEQLALLAVMIGGLILQFPKNEREMLYRVVIQNMKNADKYSTPIEYVN